ncbi:hypothetical protein COT94_04265 [Candidatus Falkowbacteria bacterium CG10_big_fil_rev_8_21_14_0_10_37_14]|uniref:Uncharacterized protein n=1 Tax=Candidatus Falkowbacteria bacterium CG10_big_fil_rev_8_21_14_0_10_37_14 TaxID=1974561 RepID=A0A2M6WSM8_9BACT|nr:MAG: hypothetical protein COT94_04265 [Candidatus Falkowbacteria bacterium CG10_big_fil_rev_8_21_14_0_10_37_14]
MTAEQIQSFLVSKNSYLSNYIVTDPNNRQLMASQAIYEISQTNRVNARFILVLLQKEQGLIEAISAKQSQLDWATGYGCPDGGSCNDRWRGLWKQINSASLQFRDYLENPNLYTYKKGQTYDFSNPYSTTIKGTVQVTPTNDGTAALYNYTPHVYNGNYNFWKLWHRYFFSVAYPNGTLLQTVDEPGVWLIQNGQRRAFLAKGALVSRFDISKVITVAKGEINHYPIGAPIRFPQYSIVRSPADQLYLLVDDTKRPFADKTVFKKLGYNPEEVLLATDNDLLSYSYGEPITAEDAYPTGALLQNNKTGGVYFVQAGTKAPLPDAVFLKTRFKNKKIISTTPAKLEKYQTVQPVKFVDGDLVKIENGFTIYVAENGLLRPIISQTAFEKLGYKINNVIIISPRLFMTYQIGNSLGGSQ